MGFAERYSCLAKRDLPRYPSTTHIGFCTSRLSLRLRIGRPVRSNTNSAVLHGIRHFFAASGLPFPISYPHIKMLLKGIGRLDIPSRRKSPVSIELLETCFLDLTMTESFDQAFWGMLCVAFFFLLGRSEIVTIGGGKFKWFAVRMRDVIVLDEDGSKTNQAGAPTSRLLSRSGHPHLCPVFGALALLKARRSIPADIPAAVYMKRNGQPSCISTADVAQVIKRAAAKTGQDPRDFSSHSLRSGGATHMYRAGTDALTIQFHGRWVSDTFKIHIRLCKESVAKLSSDMVAG
ncbi:hypothetical protein PHMEG_0004152 [Phytophthora megakarya]|uniref:Tyr recombinase domain-containing protein n=1 Tax=Phytophthora megakarya TaxID=4795 RepID=A0A225WW34_9STRA|nr:hypothetical protein PHMEG_0004152 [Phytophthora megakarya]